MKAASILLLSLSAILRAAEPSTPSPTPAKATPGIVRIVRGTPMPLHHPDPGPRERCYYFDQQNQLLIFGHVGLDGQFIAEHPGEVIDLKTHGWPISQHYPLYQDSRYRREGRAKMKELEAAMGKKTPPPAPVPGAIPGRKYYKLDRDDETLTLGTIAPSGVFILDEPRQMIDVSTQFPASLPYPYLPGTNTGWKSFLFDTDGNQIITTYKFETGTFESRIEPERYYKMDVENNTLTLGTINAAGEFIPDEPRQIIDVKKGLQFLRYPILPGSIKDWKRTYTDEQGNVIEQTWDAKTRSFQEAMRPKQ